MDNIEVGDIVEVHGYVAESWNGSRLEVTKVYGGFYEDSVSGKVISGPYAGAIAEALFFIDYLRKVEPDAADPEEAKEDPRKEKPVKAAVDLYLHNDHLSPYHYEAEFNSVEEFEAYRKNPFTELDASTWNLTNTLLRLPYRDGVLLIDPKQLKLLDISRTN